MTMDDMVKYLTNIQNQTFETKILNSILTCFAEIKNIEERLVETQNIVKELIAFLNNATKQEDAETINSQEDALVNEPAPQVSEEDK